MPFDNILQLVYMDLRNSNKSSWGLKTYGKMKATIPPSTITTAPAISRQQESEPCINSVTGPMSKGGIQDCTMRGRKRSLTEMMPLVEQYERAKVLVLSRMTDQQRAFISDGENNSSCHDPKRQHELNMIVAHHEKRMKNPAEYATRFRPEAGKFKLAEAFLDGTMPYCSEWRQTGRPKFIITCQKCNAADMPCHTRQENYWDAGPPPKTRLFQCKTCKDRLTCTQYIKRSEEELGRVCFEETRRAVYAD